MSKTRRFWAALLAAVLTMTTAGLVTAGAQTAGPTGRLVAVGPTSSQNGYPVWYRDSNGVALELCVEGGNPLCAFPPGEFPDPTQPASFPDNWPGEAFYQLADSSMAMPGGGDATLTLGVEAAFSSGEVPIDGDQITFGRVRIRIDDLQAGATYKITHPYGVETFENVAGGRRGINFVSDIGIGAPGDFTGALKSKIGPFLTWAPLSDAPAGFVGDPDVLHAVEGSPYGTNVFRIEGPGVGTPGSPDLCDPARTDCIETDLFSLVGKLATTSGVAGDDAFYSRDAAGYGSLDVFAHSDPGDVLRVSGAGIVSTDMTSDVQGNYLAHIAVPGAVPGTVTVTNLSDQPASTVELPVADRVTVGKAHYDANAHRLVVEASSSDPSAGLKVEGYGNLQNGYLAVDGLDAAPHEITVTSSKGGTDKRPTSVSGDYFPGAPLTAVALAPESAVAGQEVVLDATSSSGDITSYSWTQLEGPAVTVIGADTPRASFVAPAPGSVVKLQLSLTGPLGTVTDVVSIAIDNIQPPTAAAGPDQTVLGGSKVTLDGSGSTSAATYSWAQTGGPAVTLTGANTPKPTFTLPAGAAQRTFELTVTGPGGTATDTVVVTSQVDTVNGTAEYRTRDAEWRISGASSVAGPGNTITIYLGSTTDGKVVGTAQVDATGAWEYRLKGTQVPRGTATTVSFRSSVGGVRLAVPISVKN